MCLDSCCRSDCDVPTRTVVSYCQATVGHGAAADSSPDRRRWMAVYGNVCIVQSNLMEIVLPPRPLLLVYNWLLLFWQADRLWLPPQYSNTTGCATNLNSVNNPAGPFHRPALAMTVSLLTLIRGRKGLSFSGREVELNVFQMSNFQIFFLTFALSLSREWSFFVNCFQNWTLSYGGLDRNENKS